MTRLSSCISLEFYDRTCFFLNNIPRKWNDMFKTIILLKVVVPLFQGLKSITTSYWFTCNYIANLAIYFQFWLDPQRIIFFKSASHTLEMFGFRHIILLGEKYLVNELEIQKKTGLKRLCDVIAMQYSYTQWNYQQTGTPNDLGAFIKSCDLHFLLCSVKKKKE